MRVSQKNLAITWKNLTRMSRPRDYNRCHYVVKTWTKIYFHLSLAFSRLETWKWIFPFLPHHHFEWDGICELRIEEEITTTDMSRENVIMVFFYFHFLLRLHLWFVVMYNAKIKIYGSIKKLYETCKQLSCMVCRVQLKWDE